VNAAQSMVIDWLADGRRVGMSSRTMALWLAFDKRTGDRGFGPAHPHDPADLDRCLFLLALVPELRPRLPRMAELSAEWSRLIERWDEIEASHIAEVGLGWTKARRAPKTYALMREVLG
jgi:hypothetical protein